jgi:adenylate cyclase
MARETERKFLVASPDWRSLAGRKALIRQFYVYSARDRSARIRIMDGDKASMTLKFSPLSQRGDALEREEFTFPVSLDEALAMATFAEGGIIEKVRNVVPWEGFEIEVDVFAGALEGLVMAEMELGDAKEWPRLPAWLGREVTGDPAYQNAALARAAATGAAA